MRQKLPLLLLGIAVGLIAFVCFDYWLTHNAPLYRRLERQWAEDVDTLEASKKLPAAWFDIRDVELFGGTPESKEWLSRIKMPIKTKKDGNYKMEVLVVVWEEEGKRGVLVQYNVVDLETKNNIYELGRTFILNQ